tara:strand:+ start:227 stop:880 length:654 start_codon:yes stop_codon:yes gene_type:complete
MEHTPSKVKDLFKNFSFIDQAESPILKGKMDNYIFDEFKKIVLKYSKTRKHKFGWLKNHYYHNIDNFDYRCYISNLLIEPTFILEYIRFLGSYFISNLFDFSLKEVYREIHFKQAANNTLKDNYELWINYSSQDNYSTPHIHPAALSGIIYIENTENCPTILKPNCCIFGNPGDIVIFPSSLQHQVPPNPNSKERITIAFNLNFTNILHKKINDKTR